jgi:hypothetical protein
MDRNIETSFYESYVKTEHLYRRNSRDLNRFGHCQQLTPVLCIGVIHGRNLLSSRRCLSGVVARKGTEIASLCSQ